MHSRVAKPEVMSHAFPRTPAPLESDPVIELPLHRTADHLLSEAPPPTAPAPRALLVVDPDPLIRLTLQCFFERRKFRVVQAESLAEARLAFESSDPWTAVICDNELPDGNGLEFHAWIHEQPGDAPKFLLISSALSVEAAGNVEFLAKPFTMAELEDRVLVWQS